MAAVIPPPTLYSIARLRDASEETQRNRKRPETTEVSVGAGKRRNPPPPKKKKRMGGESSKHSNASRHARSHERKRGAASNALTGVSCHSDTVNERTARLGPPYGEVPVYIPTSPVQCAASPISLSCSLDASLTWILDTEAALITEWNRKLHEVTTHSAEAHGVSRGREPPAQESTPSLTKTSPESGARTAAPKTLGLTSFSTLPVLQGLPSQAHANSSFGLSLTCDSVDVTTGRSTGMTFRVPTMWAQQTSSSATASTKALTGVKSPQALSGPLSGSSQGASQFVVSSLPVGIDYFCALQSRWLARDQCSLLPATDEEDLNDSVILEAVSESNGDALSPPVPLEYMIDLFVPQWRSEGLFEAAQDHQAR
ncbi:hypothetical protein, conserved [Leishmania tarentolae]|uniref:Uncharacterized protein n=1 Tax=Leishmania tarentolae TaxID=5689 RepID=A0A640KK05_LEITA|nr:hypothetical protein, conserved [Leishmania tarentolae]